MPSCGGITSDTKPLHSELACRSITTDTLPWPSKMQRPQLQLDHTRHAALAQREVNSSPAVA